MAGSDIEVVKAVFQAFAERDVDTALAHADAEIVFSPVTSDYAGRTEPYRGHEGIRQYFRDVSAVWDHISLTPTDFRQLDQTILVTGKVNAHSPARIVAGSTGWIWRMRAGKVVYGRVYPSASDATEAFEAA
jgi:ketosteroid isomerase-like protein